ncbi:MAG TPA: hypothetical protein HPQ04_05270 [Rhodospirillaceae bacterium]|nr:hypothetical protein [Rhodospirillaceae bacterium]
MQTFRYNDIEFSLTVAGDAWDLASRSSDGREAIVGTGLFAGAGADDALLRAKSLSKTIYPAGIRLVGPDVDHPLKIGDMKIVGPDVSHPNLIYWDKDSTSFPRTL